jgi:hypothetical protein
MKSMLRPVLLMSRFRVCAKSQRLTETQEPTAEQLAIAVPIRELSVPAQLQGPTTPATELQSLNEYHNPATPPAKHFNDIPIPPNIRPITPEPAHEITPPPLLPATTTLAYVALASSRLFCRLYGTIPQRYRTSLRDGSDESNERHALCLRVCRTEKLTNHNCRQRWMIPASIPPLQLTCRCRQLRRRCQPTLVAVS